MFRKSSTSAPPSSLPTPPQPLKLRVVSYNVLSSHLASPSHFTTLNPDHLKASARLPAVLQKLECELSPPAPDSSSSENKSAAPPPPSTSTSGSPVVPVLVCLQEVSYDWAGPLHTFFANRGYHMVTGLYGRKFNGYMGVALAWPIGMFETLDVSVTRLSDTREGGWPRPPPADPNGGTIVSAAVRAVGGKLQSWMGTALQTVVASPVRFLLGWPSTPSNDNDAEPWDYAERRMNVLLAATLRDKATGTEFCVATYHMPCSFWDLRIMAIHADLAVRHVQRVAASSADDSGDSKSRPYLFAGDFNIKPDDSIYKLLTTGELSKDDSAHPTPKHSCEWKPSLIEPVRSAYAVHSNTGNEPDFTNYAQIKKDDPFIDTLDYIFVSPHWDVDAVRELPSRQETGGPFPNLDRGEPSDHLLIAATVSLKSPDSTSSTSTG